MIIFKPSKQYVSSLKVGDTAIDCFGKPAKVLEIMYRGGGLNKDRYVCVTLEQGPTSSISESYRIGCLHATVALSSKYSSAEIRELEHKTPIMDTIPWDMQS